GSDARRGDARLRVLSKLAQNQTRREGDGPCGACLFVRTACRGAGGVLAIWLVARRVVLFGDALGCGAWLGLFDVFRGRFDALGVDLILGWRERFVWQRPRIPRNRQPGGVERFRDLVAGGVKLV